jgi:uncharacterized protein (TIGR00251 family)
MTVFIWVQPGAKTTEAAGRHGGDPRLRVAARPEDGKANAEVIAFLAQALGVPRSDVRIVAGLRARRKRLELPDGVQARFIALFEG